VGRQSRVSVNGEKNKKSNAASKNRDKKTQKRENTRYLLPIVGDVRVQRAVDSNTHYGSFVGVWGIEEDRKLKIV